MESGHSVSRRGRKLGSSRRWQKREPADGQDAPVAPGPETWSSQADAELQAFFQDCGAKDRGFITREDLAEVKFSFLGTKEEPQMIFDWVDAERRGHLSLEEFSSGLKNIFASSQSTHRLCRNRPLPSQRVSVTTGFPALEEADAEEKEAFLALMGQLGTGHFLPEQAETWQLWKQLRQEEPHLAGNLEGLVARMSHHLREARADSEVLEQTLRKRDADHHRQVQQLYEETEQQIRQEKQQLQEESDSRGLALSAHMQEVLEAKEREVQQLADGQKELEAQIHSLSSTRQEVNSENQQLRETERDLAGQLEEVRGQLQVTRGRLDAARGRVSWQMEEEPSVPRASEKATGLQSGLPEETLLPGLFGDSDDWDQLLSSFSSAPHRALQFSWSPPPTPKAALDPQTPRVVRQISISKTCTLLSGQEPSSDAEGAPKSPPRGSSSAEDGKGGDSRKRGLDPEQPEPRGLELASEPKPRPLARFLLRRPGAPAGESGSLGPVALKARIPVEDGPPPQGRSPPPQAPSEPSKQFQASDDKGPGSGPVPAKPPRQKEVLHQDLRVPGSEPSPGSQGAVALTERSAEPSQGLEPVGQDPTVGLARGEPGPAGWESYPGGQGEAPGPPPRQDGLQSLEEQPDTEEEKPVPQGGPDLSSLLAIEAPGLETQHLESPQREAQPAPPPSDTPPALAEEEEDLAAGKPAPPRGSPPMGAQPGATLGPQEPTQTLPTLAALETHPRPPTMPAQAMTEPGTPQSRDPGANTRPQDPATDSEEAELTSSPGYPVTGKLQADPDYLFHVIFVGDSNVGKTSFLHLLHQNAFATGLSATVGVDFRVKNLLVDNKCFALQLWDTAGQERYHSMTRQLLRKAGAVVLMYDITSQESFAHVRYWLDCVQDAGTDGAVILLLGNKMDCEAERQVPTEAGQQLAQELGVSFGECSAALGHNILEPMVNLARSLKVQEDRLKGSLVKVAPEKPPKRAVCCF